MMDNDGVVCSRDESDNEVKPRIQRDQPTNGASSNIAFRFDRHHADIVRLRELVEQEHWTIEYYASMPRLSLIKPPEEKLQVQAQDITEADLHRLQSSGGSTQIWGCKICHRFFNYPSLLFDDLFKNHNIKPDATRCSEHIVKLEVKNSDLFRVLKK